MRKSTLFFILLGSVGCMHAVVWHAQTRQNKLEPYVVEYLERAQQRIWVMQYRLTSAPCVHALVRAQRRGIDVRIILDRGMCKSPAYHFVTRALREGGVHVWWLGPIPLFHHKVAIIDNQVITGSANWTRPGLQTNAEGVLVIDDPSIVQGYVSHFTTLVRRATGMKEYTLRNNAAVFFIPDHKKDVRQALTDALGQAKKQICIAMYACTASWSWQLLAAAAARGVLVQVLLEPTQVDSTVLRRYAYKNGIEVHRYSSPAGILHHKLAIIDDELWYGSMNWTRAGMRHNQENVVRIADISTVAAATQAFTALFTESAGSQPLV